MVQNLATQHLSIQERQCPTMAEVQALKIQTHGTQMTKTKPGPMLPAPNLCSWNHNDTMKHGKLEEEPNGKTVQWSRGKTDPQMAVSRRSLFAQEAWGQGPIPQITGGVYAKSLCDFLTRKGLKGGSPRQTVTAVTGTVPAASGSLYRSNPFLVLKFNLVK